MAPEGDVPTRLYAHSKPGKGEGEWQVLWRCAVSAVRLSSEMALGDRRRQPAMLPGPAVARKESI